MSQPSHEALLVRVRLHEARYHGVPEWPPGPGRLFQALVAAAARGDTVPETAAAALRWLETLPPPVVGAPRGVPGARVRLWVPNNDLDAKGGDPAEVAGIRSAKTVQPRLLQADVPFLYAWTFAATPESGELARIVCRVADGLYQLGRGVDMAWAEAELLTPEALEDVLLDYAGQVFRPTPGGEKGGGEKGGGEKGGARLACPVPGTFASLVARFDGFLERVRPGRDGRQRVHVFRQPPKPVLAHLRYASPPVRALFDLSPEGSTGRLAVWPLRGAVAFTTGVRDAAAARLVGALPERADDVERYLVGRPVAERAARAEERVRIIPLPSIGHREVDRGIRRVLLEIPAACPLRADDLRWAFSGIEIAGTPTTPPITLVPSTESGMLAHYGVGGPAARRWRTVTAVALPGVARRGPARGPGSRGKGGEERAAEERRAGLAVSQAVRHAQVPCRVRSVRVQREPFEARGARAESFAEGTRFAAPRLWHVEIEFEQAVDGPVLVGDGRFLGLGLLAPVRN